MGTAIILKISHAFRHFRDFGIHNEDRLLLDQAVLPGRGSSTQGKSLLGMISSLAARI